MAVKLAERSLAPSTEGSEGQLINLSEPYVGKSEDTQRLVKLVEISIDTKNVPVLWGPPGIGKTALIEAIVQRRGMMMRTIIGSTMDPTDVAGLPLLKTLPNGESVTAYALPEWFVEVREFALANPQGSVVFIDEITTATPPVQAALLTFIQDRRIGKTKLPDNVLIIVAGNPPSLAADGNQLAPPTANRMIHVNHEPNKPDFFEGMSVAWNKPVSQREKLMRNYIVGFLRENNEFINNCPEDVEKAGQAWPSMRSWDNAARMLGRVEPANGAGRKAASEAKTLSKEIVVGAVGEDAGLEFMRWMEKLSLPRYESVMANPEGVDWASLRGDVLHMTLANVIQNVTVENLNESMAVFNAAKGAKKDDIVGGLILSFKRKAAEEYEKAGLDTKPLAREFARLAVKTIGDLHKRATAG